MKSDSQLKKLRGKTLIIIGGPTASGKTALSIKIAEHFQTEILSCDSRQFYREMSIGTAKPNAEELATVPHHFINTLSINDVYTVGDYEREAIALLKELFERHDVVVMVGGSGLFVNVVSDGINDFPDVPDKIKKELEDFYQLHGLQGLQKELQQRDPNYYAQVDTKNARRLIRALEISWATGRPFSYYRDRPRPQRDFSSIYIALEWEREKLYERINQRVDLMMEEGLEKEAKQLYPRRSLKSLQTVGYQELFRYFDGEIDKTEAIELIKRNSRRYAKRQLTWLRREGDRWNYFSPNATTEVIEFLQKKTRGLDG